tara:strand:- start:750 stop:962 length:213 start_codon:yes stop_codon:yes gene_type:complete
MTATDFDIIENHPELIALRERLTILEKRKDELHKGSNDNSQTRLQYDAAVIRWARAYNEYETALRAVVLP